MTQSQNLSKRQREVVELLLQGKSNKQIALALGITESTVEFHLKNVYAKLQVSSRAEAILKLGKSTGLIDQPSWESIVERGSEITHTSGKFISEKDGVIPLKDIASPKTKDVEMKNRLFFYFLAGCVFGGLFWFYFSAIGKLVNRFSINEENVLSTWVFLSIEFLLIFGVWLVPTLFPMRQEFRLSKKIGRSVGAVVITWVSAVLGYYITYLVLLAFIGLPNMESYLVFRPHSLAFWQDWAELFPKLILFKFLQWTIVSIVIGGFAGLVTSSLYSFWIKKTHTVLPA